MTDLLPGAPVIVDDPIPHNPYPIISQLPAVMQGDKFLARYLAGLDEVLGPIVFVIDNLEWHLDRGLAPHSVARWMAGWLGLPVDERIDFERR